MLLYCDSRVVATETFWPTKSKIVIMWPFKKKLLPSGLKGNFVIKGSFYCVFYNDVNQKLALIVVQDRIVMGVFVVLVY